MAGSISLSLSQQFDSLGKPLNAGLLYFFAAGTTTPQSAFQDTGLTIPWPNPITLDAAGRVPQLYFADGQIKFRLTDSDGVIQVAADNVLVIGPSSGSGGGGGVDATTVLQTGQMVCWYGTGSQTGFVRLNAKTIGSSTSGATERANADTLALFTFLWNADANLAVSTGRGVSAAADWAANKNIALPDARGRSIAGLDDMGNSAAGRLTNTYFGTAATVLGAAGGVESSGLITANLPPYTPAGTNTPTANAGGNVSVLPNAPSATLANVGSAFGVYSTTQWFQLTVPFTGTAQGGTSTPFKSVGPRLLATVYIKL